MFPARRTTPRGSIPMQPSRVNLNVVFTCAIAVRVSLSDCFCSMGQMYRGFENPRILAWKASQSERLTRVTLHQNLHAMPF